MRHPNIASHTHTHSTYTKTTEYEKKKQNRIDQIQRNKKRKKNNTLDNKNHSKLPYLLFCFYSSDRTHHV
jgi:hypothetical protein